VTAPDRLPAWSRLLLWERERRGWSRPQLRLEVRAAARHLKEVEPQLDVVTIRRWEIGATRPSAYYARLLCQVYGTTADRLGLIPAVAAPAVGTGDGRTGDVAAPAIVHPQGILDAWPGLPSSPGKLLVDDQAMGSGPSDDPAGVEESMRRRAFTRYLALLGGAAALDPGGIAGVLQRMGQVDDGLADRVHDRVLRYMGQWDEMPSHVLLPAVVEEVRGIEVALDRTLPSTLARRLHVVASEALAFSGLLCWYMQQRAMVMIVRADFHSKVQVGGGQGSAISRSMLEAAEAAGGAGPSIIRAWALLRRAEEHAVIGDGTTSGRCLDLADAAFAAVGAPAAGMFAHWGPDMHQAFRGNCEQLLQRYSASVATLSEVLDRIDPAAVSNRVALQADIASVMARQGEVDEACALLSTSLSSAAASGLRYRVRRIAGIRGVQLAGREAEPAVRRLDEQLLAIA
jgi:hypothetical protein